MENGVMYFSEAEVYKGTWYKNGKETGKVEVSPDSFEPNSPPSSYIISAYDVWVDLQIGNAIASFGNSCQVMELSLRSGRVSFHNEEEWADFRVPPIATMK